MAGALDDGLSTIDGHVLALLCLWHGRAWIGRVACGGSHYTGLDSGTLMSNEFRVSAARRVFLLRRGPAASLPLLRCMTRKRGLHIERGRNAPSTPPVA
jgi:hypothetical protein